MLGPHVNCSKRGEKKKKKKENKKEDDKWKTKAAKANTQNTNDKLIAHRGPRQHLQADVEASSLPRQLRTMEPSLLATW